MSKQHTDSSVKNKGIDVGWESYRFCDYKIGTTSYKAVSMSGIDYITAQHLKEITLLQFHGAIKEGASVLPQQKWDAHAIKSAAEDIVLRHGTAGGADSHEFADYDDSRSTISRRTTATEANATATAAPSASGTTSKSRIFPSAVPENSIVYELNIHPSAERGSSAIMSPDLFAWLNGVWLEGSKRDSGDSAFFNRIHIATKKTASKSRAKPKAAAPASTSDAMSDAEPETTSAASAPAPATGAAGSEPVKAPAKKRAPSKKKQQQQQTEAGADVAEESEQVVEAAKPTKATTKKVSGGKRKAAAAVTAEEGYGNGDEEQAHSAATPAAKAVKISAGAATTTATTPKKPKSKSGSTEAKASHPTKTMRASEAIPTAKGAPSTHHPEHATGEEDEADASDAAPSQAGVGNEGEEEENEEDMYTF